jgi:hypothetical protein
VKITKQMSGDGVIKRLTSACSSPIIPVRETLDASGKQELRLVVDFRRQNEVTVGG